MNQIDQVLNLKPQTVTIPFKELVITSNDDVRVVNIKGFTAVMDPSAGKDLIELAGLNQSAVETIKSTSGKNASRIVLQQAFKALNDRSVTLAFSGNRISRVAAPDSSRLAISNVKVAGAADMLVKKGMKVWGIQVSPDQTRANIQLVNSDVVHHPTSKNESISVGRSINWDAFGGTSIHDFVERLVCSNGNVSKEDGRIIQMLDGSTNVADIYKALFSRDNESERIAKYFERMTRLQESRMSVREWNNYSKHLKLYRKDMDVVSDQLGCNVQMTKEGDLVVDWEAEYIRSGINLKGIGSNRQRVCQTPINWWDMVNCMTWLASHEMKSTVNSWTNGEMMNVAGQAMAKQSFDSDLWMTGLPSFN